MAQVDDVLIAEMVKAIVDEVDPEKVVLFGSRGRRAATERSDVDLLVIQAEPFGPGRSRHSELVKLYDALSAFVVPADVLVYSLADVEHWRDSLNHVLARALREGRTVYERP